MRFPGRCRFHLVWGGRCERGCRWLWGLSRSKWCRRLRFGDIGFFFSWRRDRCEQFALACCAAPVATAAAPPLACSLLVLRFWRQH